MTEQQRLHIDRYEKRWIKISIATLFVFAVFVLAAGFAFGFQVPGAYERVNPQTVTDSGAFAEPGLREISPGNYEAYITAQAFFYTPREITVPAGSKVTFYITSVDVQHGFKLQGTNINVMVVPGQVSTLSSTFEKPGEYDFICTEYCGAGHAAMSGKLIVEG